MQLIYRNKKVSFPFRKALDKTYVTPVRLLRLFCGMTVLHIVEYHILFEVEYNTLFD